jgi:hypothetical protein
MPVSSACVARRPPARVLPTHTHTHTHTHARARASQFMKWATAVRTACAPHWCDAVDPCSGLPVRYPSLCSAPQPPCTDIGRSAQAFGARGSSFYNEVAGAQSMLGFDVIDVGCCKVSWTRSARSRQCPDVDGVHARAGHAASGVAFARLSRDAVLKCTRGCAPCCCCVRSSGSGMLTSGLLTDQIDIMSVLGRALAQRAAAPHPRPKGAASAR